MLLRARSTGDAWGRENVGFGVLGILEGLACRNLPCLISDATIQHEPEHDQPLR
jgi:hypothetical protein